MPSISVIVPTYNSWGYVQRAIGSVLTQTRKPDELIIVDDCSEVSFSGLIREGSFTVQLIRHRTNRGAGAARNTGIRAATSKWIAFLDADDAWEPEKLQSVEWYITNFPQYEIFCHSEYHGTKVVSYEAPVKKAYHRSILSTSAVVCRRDVLMQVGLFDESIRSGIEDFELWLRLLAVAKVKYLAPVLGHYHTRPGNLTNSRYLAKWKDSIKIAWRYRRQVAAFDMIARLCIATAQYGWLGFRDTARKTASHFRRLPSGVQSSDSR